MSYMLTDGMCMINMASWSHDLLYTAGKNIWEEGKDSDDNIQYDRRKVPHQVIYYDVCHYHIIIFMYSRNNTCSLFSWVE